MSAAIAQLMENSLRSGLLILAVLLLRAVLHKLPKRNLCMLWTAVWLRLALPVAIRSRFSILPNWTSFGQTLSAVNDGQQLTTATASSPVHGMDWGLTVWIAGLSSVLLFALIRWLLLKRKVREAIPLRDRLWLCDWVETSFLLGLFRPRIYLPSDTAESDLPYIEAHETAHLRHGDPWRTLAAFLLTAIYWFSPLVWIAFFLYRRDLELACDERACREYDADRRAAYVDALMRAANSTRSVWTSSLSFSAAPVKKRALAVLHPPKCRRGVVFLAAIVSTSVLLCLTVETTVAEFVPEPATETMEEPTAIPSADQAKETDLIGDSSKKEDILSGEDTIRLIQGEEVISITEFISEDETGNAYLTFTAERTTRNGDSITGDDFSEIGDETE